MSRAAEVIRAVGKAHKKAMKKLGRKLGSMILKLIPPKVLLTIIAILIFIFMIPGIVSYIINMPGVVMDQICNIISEKIQEVQEKIDKAGEELYKSASGEDSTNTIYYEELEESTKGALEYLEKMGIDPVGFGFVFGYQKDDEGVKTYQTDLYPATTLAALTGVEVDEEDGAVTVPLPIGTPLFSYILSNEKTTLTKKYQIGIGASAFLKGFEKFFKKDSDSIVRNDGLLYFDKLEIDLGNDFRIPLKLNGNIKNLNETINAGIDNLPGAVLGNILGRLNITVDMLKELVGKNTDMEINRQTRTLSITADENLFGADKGTFEYGLDDWVGRYGKPLEFLIALHLATMSSGIPDEMTTNEDLQTEVHIDLHKQTYDVDFEDITIQRGDNGEIISIPIKYGQVDTEEIQTPIAKISFDEEKMEYTYEYYEPEKIEENGLTICDLKAILDELRMGYELNSDYEHSIGYDHTRFANIEAEQKAKQEESLYDIFMREAMDVVVNGSGNYGGNEDGRFYMKYDIVNYPVTDRFLGAYLGTLGGMVFNQADENWNVSHEFNANDYVNGSDGKSNPINISVYNSEETVDEENMEENIFSEDPSKKMVSSAKQILYYLDEIKENKIDQARIGIVLVQIDQYLKNYLPQYMEGAEEIGIDALKGEEPFNMIYNEYDITNSEFYASIAGEDKLYLRFSRRWLDICYNQKWNEVSDLCNDLLEVREFMDRANRRIARCKLIAKMLVDRGVDEDTANKITEEYIDAIYDALYEKSLEKPSFVEPRISYVTKHWFKDIEFQRDGDSAYEYKDKDISIPIDSENNILERDDEGNIRRVEIVINAEEKLINGKHYVQVKQPYVVKGKIVSLEGKVQDNLTVDKEGNIVEKNSENENDVVTREATGKKFGLGYEASKKIFTQGNYYIYDGSEDTAKSIYFCKMIEAAGDGAGLEVTVNDAGKIVFLKPGSGAKNDTLEVGSATVSGGGVNDGGNKVYSLTINQQLKYLSPVEVDYQKSLDSVDAINGVLDEMGVVTKRKPVNFDGKTADGSLMTQTAFAILEGMKTKSSQYIYRDLKEFLVELGYFSKAEIDKGKTEVLKWFIPTYVPIGGKNWPENKDEDIIEYGAVLYPKDENADEDDEKRGFGAGANVIAPGNANIIESAGDHITLEFDCTNQEEISSVDGYTMTIFGISVEAGSGSVEAGDTIGKTGKEKIRVVMKDTNGAILSNIPDYMVPPENAENDLGYFYWLYYESGANPASYSSCSSNEVAVGLSQWTVIPGYFNNITEEGDLIGWLMEHDESGITAGLGEFRGWSGSQILSDYYGEQQLRKAFEDIADENKEEFMKLQEAKILEEIKDYANQKGVGWLLERTPVVVGTWYSFMNWAPNAGWEGQINTSMSDGEIIMALFKYGQHRGSTAGDLSSRWNSQARLAMDILTGDFDDVEGWLDNPGQYPQYHQGRNPGYIDSH